MGAFYLFMYFDAVTQTLPLCRCTPTLHPLAVAPLPYTHATGGWGGISGRGTTAKIHRASPTLRKLRPRGCC